MKRGIWLTCGMVCFIFAIALGVFPSLAEEQPPMVERHIFSPEPYGSEKGKGDELPDSKRLEKELEFTGVILSPEGRFALIKEKVGRKERGSGEKQKWLLKEGDEILGMTLQKIGPNYVVLAGEEGEEKEIKLRLFHGQKKRPAPPRNLPHPLGRAFKKGPTMPRPVVGSKGSKAKRVAASIKQAQRAKRTLPIARRPHSAGSRQGQGGSAFLQALKRAAERTKARRGNAPEANNPFSELIRRSQGQ